MTAPASAKVFTVTELNQFIRDVIAREPRLQSCCVSGEISNFKHHSSGHMYFTLKDEKSRLRAVMFAGRARYLNFVPEDGMRVIVMGSISVFDRDGQYQVYVDDMQPDGVGALYVAFTQLKERLEQEGLFRQERKRPLPRYPRCVGVVTSPTGAVIRDISTTLSRRYPLAKVVLAPALVQGPTAAATIVSAMERLTEWSRSNEPIDVIIVARGGGSLEELWPFNEEAVARAVAACSIPVVSAVGHETDFTICDFVADVRAATPTAAAEVVAPHVLDLRELLSGYSSRSLTAVRYRLADQRQRLNAVQESTVLKQPMNVVNVYRQHVDYLDSLLQQHATKPVRAGERAVAQLSDRLHRLDMKSRLFSIRNQLDQAQFKVQQTIKLHVTNENNGLERMIASLEALNPLGVLRRGYSVVYKADGQTVVTGKGQLQSGELVKIRLSDGDVSARVGEGEEPGHERNVQSRLDL